MGSVLYFYDVRGPRVKNLFSKQLPLQIKFVECSDDCAFADKLGRFIQLINL